MQAVGRRGTDDRGQTWTKLPESFSAKGSREMRLSLTGKITFVLFCLSWDQHLQGCVQAKNEHGD